MRGKRREFEKLYLETRCSAAESTQHLYNKFYLRLFILTIYNHSKYNNGNLLMENIPNYQLYIFPQLLRSNHIFYKQENILDSVMGFALLND